MAIEITRKELTAAQLRSAASKTSNAAAARRMLALAQVLEGVDREPAARSCGMERHGAANAARLGASLQR